MSEVAPAVTSVKAEPIRLYTGGRWQASRSQRVDPIPDPATGDVLGWMPHGTPAEVDAAIKRRGRPSRSGGPRRWWNGRG